MRFHGHAIGAKSVVSRQGAPAGTIALCAIAVIVCLSIQSLGSAALIQPQERKDDYDAEKQARLDLRRVWKFDDDQLGRAPGGFSAHTLGGTSPGSWQVAADPMASSASHVLKQEAPCSGDGCFQLLLAEGVIYDYLDLAFKLRPSPGQPGGVGGVVFAAQDARNFYAVVVDFSDDTMSVLRVLDGRETVLGRAPVTRKKAPWHHLRVQRNTIISKEFIEAFFDGKLTVSAEDQTLGAGRVGLVTRGMSPIEFDNIHVIRLYSQVPLSGPAAY